MENLITFNCIDNKRKAPQNNIKKKFKRICSQRATEYIKCLKVNP